MTFLVHRTLTHLTLVSLLSKTPEEVTAESAESRLSEELSDELMSFDAMYLLVSDGSPASGDT